MKRLPVALGSSAVLVVILFLPVLVHLSQGIGNAGDMYLHYYPLKYLVKERIVCGRMPLWDPYIFAGQPLLANPQAAVLYPFSLLFVLFPLTTAFVMFFMVHFLVAAMGMYLILGWKRLAPSACYIGSVTFACSSFLVSKVAAGHPVALSGYVWLPYIALAFLAATPGLSTASVPAWTLFVCGVALQMYSGHTFPLYISLMFMALGAAFLRRDMWRQFLFAGGVVLALCAAQLLPSAELSRLTEMGHWPQLVREYSSRFADLATFVLPNYFGNPRDGTYVWPEHQSFFFERHVLYIGIIPLLLGCMGLLRAVRQRHWFWPMIVVASCVLGLGFHTPLYRFLYALLPGFDLLRVPARFMFIGIFALSVLCASAWHDRFRDVVPWFKALLMIIVVVDILSANAKYIYPGVWQAYQHAPAVSPPPSPLYRIITEPDEVPANKAILYHHFNLNGYEAILLEDFVKYLGLQESKVFSATGLARTDLHSPLARAFAVGEIRGGASSGGRRTLVDHPLPRLFVARTLHPIPREEVYDQIDWLRTTTDTPDKTLMVTSVPPGYSRVSGTARITGYTISPERIAAAVVADGPVALVFSEMSYPGWHAVAAGRPVPLIRGNKVLRTVLLPSGSYLGPRAVMLYFDPLTWRFGLYSTLVALLAAMVFGIRKMTHIHPT